ncbi:hypothetical protein Tco_0420396 [Tanacetum coccineum]
MSIRELLLQEKLHKALQAICEKLNQQEQAANDSLIIGDENLSTILDKESYKFIKSSVEDLVPIPSEFEDTFESDGECDLSSCDDFSPIDVPEGKFVTFSNPLFDSNADFTSSDDESLSDEDVPEDNVKIYSNSLFEFDDEYISSDINPLFNEVLENIGSEDSYVSKLDETDLLVTPLLAFNEDECFDPGGDVDEIELLLHRDLSTPKISVATILEGFTDEPPLEENDDLFDLESKENEWKKILYKAPIDDLMTEDKVFDPEIHKKKFSPTYVSLPFEDFHYLSLTYVIRIFLPYFTYLVDSSLPFSSENEDTIFDPGILVFSLEPVASHRSGTVTGISLMDKNKAKMDKSEHEIGRVQEIEAEGAYIFKWANPFSSTILVLLLNTLNAFLLVEYPTKNPSSAFPSNIPR